MDTKQKISLTLLYIFQTGTCRAFILKPVFSFLFNEAAGDIILKSFAGN